MSRINERIEALGIDASEMTEEQKFTIATGLTKYDEDIAANDWYVPGGSANIVPGYNEDEVEDPNKGKVFGVYHGDPFDFESMSAGGYEVDTEASSDILKIKAETHTYDFNKVVIPGVNIDNLYSYTNDLRIHSTKGLYSANGRYFAITGLQPGEKITFTYTTGDGNDALIYWYGNNKAKVNDEILNIEDEIRTGESIMIVDGDTAVFKPTKNVRILKMNVDKVITPEEIETQIGNEVTDDTKKYDVNNDGNIDEEDVNIAKSSEIEIETKEVSEDE